MIPGRHHPDTEEMKNLVSEQSGLRWSMLGILFALFVGLAFRSTFSPEKINALVHRAATHIHPDLKVHFENASLSLSDGLFPELAVVVSDIEMQSAQPCWKQPLVKIDEIRLPLEFSELLRGQVKLSTVDIDHVEILLRSPDAVCEKTVGETLPAKGAPEAAAEENHAAKSDKNASTRTAPLPEVRATSRNPVENIRIRSLHFQVDGGKWPEMDLRRLRLHSDPHKKELQAQGTLVLPLESRGAGASPQADFHFYYAPNAEKPGLDLDLAGFWREGRFNFHATTDLRTYQTTAALQAEHLPLTEVLSVMHRQGILDRDLNGRQAWMSLHAHTENPEELKMDAPIKVDDFKIEGDLGEVLAQNFFVTNLSPLKAGPLNLDLRGVRLEKLFAFLGIETDSPVLADLGTFNGSLAYLGPDNLELIGEHSGLQFVFSNRGTRELQTLSLISGHARLLNDVWQVDLDRIRPLDGLFLGHVKARADRSWKNINLDVDMDELSLSSSVQKLMTGGGSLGRWSGDLHVALESGHVESLRGQINASDVMIENLSINRGQAQLSTKSGDIHMDLQGKHLRLQAPSQIFEAVRPFLNGVEAPLETDQFHMALQSKNFDELKWHLYPLAIGGLNLRSEGGWDTNGRLSGDLVQIENKTQRRWSIKGTRALPKFEVIP